ncbi:LPS export ABC transporter periplasmic protein LptC [Pseudobdellovibrio exovorus]|uniref:Organic solvent tolerance-like N-terminal domain-containing protein n=1 Tax=Pseudobdellovibrio exovorus JSS TaxID=1184267 RepID=M4V930_9BACT|nr:LPS export ABC transporter periplasmic protein LptC [Pseudobdellovibrio exovorus]AGH94955.1 hypothetical protein A11Q_735 [Pseudobdellovibrio exovorus JSS]
MRLQTPKINKYSILFFLLVAFIFLEIIIMSPNLLEQTSDEEAAFEATRLAAQNQEQKSGSIEQKLQGVHLVENAENEKGWELFAHEAIGSADSKWVVKEVKVHFFNENKLSFTVTGDVGEVDGETKDMVIRGNVTTTSTNGYFFNTDTLRYTASNKMMSSQDKVIMRGPPDNHGEGFKLTGEKLQVDIAQNKMSILEKVVATKKIDGKDFKLTSVRADFYNTNQEATFSKDVRMNLGTMHLNAPVAHFKYSQANKSLMRILLQQGVQLSDEDKRGFSEELELNLLENKMTMRGRPKVQQGEDEISGEEIVFIDGGKKVKINKSSKK